MLRPIAVALSLLAVNVACSDGDPSPSGFGVPLAADSPWPKFRRDAEQRGAAPFTGARGGPMWSFPTGKGIFSSPVVGGDGTIYVGSADRSFYALNPDGTQRWRFETGEIIDSAGLLDDQGRVYFGSGDGRLYALDAATGAQRWTFAADDPSVNGAFINWFEGNVAIGPDGRLFAPNDNFFVYGLDREAGTADWRFKVADQTWSLPAVDVANNRIFFGNNNLIPLLGSNAFGVSAADGRELWAGSSVGSVAASPLITSDGLVVMGGFDGIVRAYEAATGAVRWSFGTRDHVYASPAQLPDGTLVQPSADGTIYGLDPADGAVRWAFDTQEPIRSSPAVDGEGTIYVGSGEGRLFVLDAQGRFQWSLRLIEGDRNDLNASPALGEEALYIAGESGEIFSVPYGYCLEHPSDPACTLGPDEVLPDDGAQLLFTTGFGAPLATPPEQIDDNQALAFSLFVRASGDTALALVDSTTATVTVEPPVQVRLSVSGDRKFLVVEPAARFEADGSGMVTLTISGQYLEDFEREGLRFEGGRPAGRYTATFALRLRRDGPAASPLLAPAAPGAPGTVLRVERLAAPLPTILPSYNQIGFDSLHYLMAVVEGSGSQAVGWFMGAALDAAGAPQPDPATGVLFPMVLDYANGALTFENAGALDLEVLSARIGFDHFRLSARVEAGPAFPEAAVVSAATVCGTIEFYGRFLKTLGLCNPETDLLHAFGAAQLGVWAAPAAPAAGEVDLAWGAAGVTATFRAPSLAAEGHVLGLLLVDDTTGAPLSLDYVGARVVTEDGAGKVATITQGGLPSPTPARLRAHVMVDAHRVATATLTAP